MCKKLLLKSSVNIKSRLREMLSLITVEPSLFFYYLSVYLLFGGFQNMIFGKVCTGHFNATFCVEYNSSSHPDAFNLVQSDSSWWIKSCTMAMVVPSIITDCFLGAWSDLFGRKVTLLLPPIGGLLSAIVYTCQAALPSMGVEWAILASALMGSFGSFTSMQTGVVAYMSSITSKGNDRTVRIAIVESMTFIAGTFGPFVSGHIVTSFGQPVLFFCVGLCHLCGIFYTTLFVQNICTKNHDISKSDGWCNIIKKLFPLTHLRDCFVTCFKPRPNCGRSILLALLATSVLLIIVTAGELDIAFLFLRESPLNWDVQTFSYWFGTRYGVSSLALLLALPLAQRAGASDHLVCAIGIMSKMAALVLFAFASNTAMGFGVILLGCVGSLSLSAIRAMVSKCVEEEEQGKLFGVFAVLEDVCVLLASAIYNSIFPIIRASFHGGLFVASALALIPALVCLAAIKWKQNR